jgi:hypothetical protein
MFVRRGYNDGKGQGDRSFFKPNTHPYVCIYMHIYIHTYTFTHNVIQSNVLVSRIKNLKETQNECTLITRNNSFVKKMTSIECTMLRYND